MNKYAHFSSIIGGPIFLKIEVGYRRLVIPFTRDRPGGAQCQSQPRISVDMSHNERLGIFKVNSHAGEVRYCLR